MISFASLALQYGQPARPFDGGFWTQRLPDNASIAPTSAAAAASLASQVAQFNVNLNCATFTAEPLIVPASQPLVSVAMSGGSAAQQAIFRLGVPIPPGTRPTADTDESMIIYQPDYVSPYGPLYGRYYELWGAIPNVDANGLEHWTARYGKRMVNVNGAKEVYSVSWKTGPAGAAYATDPDSTYLEGNWTCGSGLALAPGLLTLQDAQRGYVDHALGLLVPNATAWPKWVWPATTCDGNDPTGPIPEGARFRFPPGYVIPTGLHPLAKLVAQGLRDFSGFVVDRAGSVAVRGTPSLKAAGYLGTAAEWQVFNGFPWADLQMLVPGTATVPTPVG